MSNNKSKMPELLSGCEAFQNGRDQYPSGYSTREGLDGKIGPIRCLSDGTYSSQGQRIPEISLEAVLSLLFGLVTAPRTFTKVLQPVMSHLCSMGISWQRTWGLTCTL